MILDFEIITDNFNFVSPRVLGHLVGQLDADSVVAGISIFTWSEHRLTISTVASARSIGSAGISVPVGAGARSPLPLRVGVTFGGSGRPAVRPTSVAARSSASTTAVGASHPSLATGAAVLDEHQQVRILLIHFDNDSTAIATPGSTGAVAAVTAGTAGSTVTARRPASGVGPIMPFSASLAIAATSSVTSFATARGQMNRTEVAICQRLANQLFRARGYCLPASQFDQSSSLRIGLDQQFDVAGILPRLGIRGIAPMPSVPAT
jgi:hypothetical protein